MISLADHIEYLLSEHDCVIVPGWGAFIGQYTPSYVNSGQTLINKPQKSIAFNGALTHNDGLLVSSIMRKEGIAYELASASIEQSVAALRQQLGHEGEAPVGKLGFFHVSDNGTFSFESFVSAFGHNEFFGLQSINIKPLQALSEQDEKGLAAAESSNKKRIFIPLNRNYIQIAASIIVLLCLTFVLTTPVSQQHSGQDFASVNAFDVSAPQNMRELSISMPRLERNKANVAVEDLGTAGDQTKALAKNDLAKKSSNAEESTSKDAAVYYLIVASLNSEKQARQYIMEEDNPSYRIVACNGKYRVYADCGDFQSMTVAQRKIQSSHSDAWIFKK